MEGNGLSARMYSNAGAGMLGLDIPLHHSNQPQIQLQKHQQQMMSSNQQHNLQQLQQHEQQQTQLSMKQPLNYNISYSNPNSNLNLNPNLNLKTKSPVPNSDDDEATGQNDNNENATIDGKRKGGASSSSNMSPWQRMKWTDNMVRLLIMAVYYIGDESGNEVGPEKKKLGPGGPSGGGGGGLLQKKGKWKSVSRAMMEKGFYVSPQQCEDKFNDLNKRYKRVNDILGKGTACKVVENQALLETMELSPKMKEEVRKLLNSKHLFFREMCAYHNSCGHGAAGGATTATDGTQNPAVCATDVHHAPHSMPHQLQHQQQQPCSHSSAIAPPSMEHNGMHKLEHEDDDDEDDFEDDDDDEDEDQDEDDEDEHDDEGGRPRKRARTDGRMEVFSQALQQFNGEIVGVLQDESKNPWQKKIWMKIQLLQLEEQGLNYETEALDLEKQRLKWVRFSSKKERQWDKLKLENHRKRIETKRMILMLKQKENELIGDPNPSSVTS